MYGRWVLFQSVISNNTFMDDLKKKTNTQLNVSYLKEKQFYIELTGVYYTSRKIRDKPIIMLSLCYATVNH